MRIDLVPDKNLVENQGLETFRARRQILKSKPFHDIITVPSTKTSQFCFISWLLHCMRFSDLKGKHDTLKTAPEKLSRLSRNRPLRQAVAGPWAEPLPSPRTAFSQSLSVNSFR